MGTYPVFRVWNHRAHVTVLCLGNNNKVASRRFDVWAIKTKEKVPIEKWPIRFSLTIRVQGLYLERLRKTVEAYDFALSESPARLSDLAVNIDSIDSLQLIID